MISANATNVLRLAVVGLTALWETATTETPLTPPPVVRGVWDSWWPWLGVRLLGSLLCFLLFFAIHWKKTKRFWVHVQLKKGNPEARKEEESRASDVSRYTSSSYVSKSPSISLTLTKEEINNSVSLYKEKFKSMGIDIIDHGVLEYTSDIIGHGRYSQVYAVKRTWPGHRMNVPLCVKSITNKKSSAIFQTCIEVLNVAELLGVPGVPRVVAVCLKPPPLIVMTQHSRTTLDVVLSNHFVSDLFLLKVCYQLCVTLDLIHRRKKVHNDVKGNNICVDVKAGNHPKVTLIDYGLMTREGEKLFKSPTTEMDRMKAVVEHSRSYPWYDLGLYMGGPASPQTDIYSVAVLLRQVMRVMRQQPAALQACVREGLGVSGQRPPLTRFKAVLQASIMALNDKRQ